MGLVPQRFGCGVSRVATETCVCLGGRGEVGYVRLNGTNTGASLCEGQNMVKQVV